MFSAAELKIFFEKKYDRKLWYRVLRENFNVGTLKEKPVDITPRIRSNDYKATALELGSFVTIDGHLVGIYEIEVPGKVQIHRNRKGLKELLQNVFRNDVEAALLVFIQGNKWRFSYVSEITVKNTTTGKREKKSTDGKRFTYLMGEGERCKTASERFLRIKRSGDLSGGGTSLDALEEAFNVDKMSKAFFNEYRKQYGHFTAHLTGEDENGKKIKNASPFLRSTFNGDHKAARDFVKKMMGRIVFLYFLGKKGWLGVPEDKKWGNGEEDFLRKLFVDSKDKKAFYSNILAPLFFTTLNTERKNDLFKIDDKLFTRSGYSKLKIPYLNGGLFEEDEALQSLDFPEELFADLFTFFDQYNFTVYEDSPDEHTVAVDPEMLGHIFENLLEDNKDKGAFYTPKEIVHYMCRESLVEYLYSKLNPGEKENSKETVARKAIEKFVLQHETGDIINAEEEILKALKAVKICDPAIGSGAFPMGLLMEIYYLVETLFNRSKDVVNRIWKLGTSDTFNAAKVKEQIIQNSIYGVDIEKGAVDIARLRFWLSLVVDEDNPKPLPNLDYKIVVGNSLLSKFEDEVIDIEWNYTTSHGTAETKKLIAELVSKLYVLQSKQDLYFNIKAGKQGLQQEIRNLKIEILIIQQHIARISFQQSHPKLGGFAPTSKEIQKNLENESVLKGYEQTITKLGAVKKDKNAPLHFFDWKLDFPEVMNDKIVKGEAGFDIVIGNPPYVSAVTMARDESTKENFKAKFPQATGSYDLYLLFLLQASNLANKKGCYTWIIPNKFLISDYAKKTTKYLQEECGLSYALNVSTFNVFEGIGVYPIIIFGKMDQKYQFEEYILSDYENLSIKKFDKPQQLKEHQTIKDIGLKINSGATGFQAQKIKPYITDKKLVKSIPFVVSGSIDRYYWNNQDVRYMGDLYEEAYIHSNKEVAASKWKFWTSPKIVIAGMTKKIEAVYVETPLGLGVGIYGIYDFAGLDPYALTAVLNSKYLTHYFQIKFKHKHLAGGYLAINKSTIEEFPLANISDKVQSRLNVLSVEIHNAKKKDQDSSLKENKVDLIVYKLYDLSYGEACNVEGSKDWMTQQDYEKFSIA